ncbi:hypothetical protein [Qipengyuania aquimaris]|uniref:hypothetical protein n=1 Tax=Qipengyuania aquimaris TaxID=255984 RepID=UPI001FD47854|nr:hypothetical protein [Qipengyuania aquimaris]UOR14675.1 hypothetical protein LCM05_09260 [Qipengyuania aquimaris]
MTSSRSFHHENLIEAWRAASTHLATPSQNEFIWIVGCETAWQETPQALRKLDSVATAHNFERPSAIANMLFPVAAAAENLSVAEATEKGLELFGRGRAKGLRFSNWRHTYFERLSGQSVDGNGRRERFRDNKLSDVIAKLNAWNKNAESALFIHTSLDSETFRTRGGPCLQYVQFRAHGQSQLDIIGLYRAHDYGNKALGNLIGLDRLGRFVARHTGRQLNQTSVVSLHPFADSKARLRNFANLVTP